MALSQSEIAAAYTVDGRLRKAINGTEVSADYLGIAPHCMPVANKCGLPHLGHPAPNSPKQYARVDLEEKAQDRKWLSKLVDAIQLHWRDKHARAAAKKISPQNHSTRFQKRKQDGEALGTIPRNNEATEK